MYDIIKNVVARSPKSLDEIKIELKREIKESGLDFSANDYNEMFNEIILNLM